VAACATTTTTSTSPATAPSTLGSTTTAAPTTVVTTATEAPPTSSAVPALPTTQLTVGDTALEVWVADESLERQQGLRAVEQLPEGVDGMLFVFPEPAIPNFIMSGTLIPLEVWFFDPQGALIGSHEMRPCPSDPCTLYPAPGRVGWAIETPLDERDFQIGDLLSVSASG
jgi:uncharacterized membrane protein (UPF0127 family)